MRYTFPAVFEPSRSGFGVYFPDLPGCTSAGADLETATEAAAEALALHLEGMAEDKEMIPEASRARDIVAATRAEGVDGQVILISAEGPDGGERVNVYMPKGLLERIDRYAERRGMKGRSTVLTLAAREYLASAEQGLSESDGTAGRERQ